MAKGRGNGNGHGTADMTIRELANALTEKLDQVRTEVSSGFGDLSDKMTQIKDGVAGIARLVKLEERVAELERRLNGLS